MVTPLPVHGADVSHHQPALDLARAKQAGLDFLYHKATEGDTFVDPEYTARRAQAKKAGVPFGAYHFARAEYLARRTDAKAEARRFIAVAKPKPGDLRPALDLETSEGLTPGQLKAWAREFSDEVHRLTGVRPVLYSPWVLGLALTKWVPRYNDQNEPPRIPWDIWQFSNGDLGKPDTFPGLGRVDLNTFRKGFGVKDLLIAAKPKPEPVRNFTNLKVGHFSLQYKDTKAQKSHDADKVFALDLDLVTGTEAGQRELRVELREAARREGYFIHFGRGDAWVAVKKDLVKGPIETGDEWVMSSKEGVGKHSHRTVPWISFDTDKLGRITLASGHYLTKGRRPGDPNYLLNVRYARIIGDLADRKSAGNALFFYGGDQNIVDRTDDTFFGEGLTSLQDELKQWEGTGHGNIDVFATVDRDGRVTAISVEVLRDSEFPLFTDHFGVRGRVKVEHLRAA
jgi:GH25 family lysozyme M1 (1,4-beta-N-acetylmuramidase)